MADEVQQIDLLMVGRGKVLKFATMTKGDEGDGKREMNRLLLAQMFHELLLRDHEDGRPTGQPQGVGSEAYLNGTSQGPTPEDARKDGHILGRSKLFMKYPG